MIKAKTITANHNPYSKSKPCGLRVGDGVGVGGGVGNRVENSKTAVKEKDHQPPSFFSPELQVTEFEVGSQVQIFVI